jgi:hypothetical protein
LEIAPLKEANELFVKEHYLHRGRTMAQVAYWIILDGERVGALLYALPRMSVRSDRYGGHSPMELLELARLWIHPSVQVKTQVDRHGRVHALCIASASISRSLRRIRADWHGKYPHLPQVRAVVSWADISRHRGTIYTAANFTCVGLAGGAKRSTGSRGASRVFHADYANQKVAFLYPFKGDLSDRDKAAAVENWADKRPRRRQRRRS